MNFRQNRLIIGIAVVLIILALAIMTRYTYYTVQGPILYKLDRWTGRIWVIRPDEITLLSEKTSDHKSLADVVESEDAADPSYFDKYKK